jgi:hypothetical protein
MTAPETKTPLQFLTGVYHLIVAGTGLEHSEFIKSYRMKKCCKTTL